MEIISPEASQNKDGQRLDAPVWQCSSTSVVTYAAVT